VTPAEWLRAMAQAPWWQYHGALAIELVTMAEPVDGKQTVRVTSDALAVRLCMSRTSLRRALDVLQAAGFCVVVGSKGRGGETVITMTDRRPFEIASNSEQKQTLDLIGRDGSGHIVEPTLDIIRTVETSIPDDSGDAQLSEMVCESLADLGDRGHFQLVDPDIIGSSDVVEGKILGRSAPISRARDLDLLRSPDLRSSDLQDPRRSGDIQIRGNGADEKPAKKRRVDPAKIPERAWLAADYLRGRVLQEDPAAAVGRKPWEETAGLRLAWANEFRLIHERDARPWDEIARVVYWLFHKQSGTARFVVQSPESLREKWDRIQAVRRNQSQQDKRGADGRPDPQAERAFKTINPSNVWGDQ
jgi:hypothetical protein